MTEGSNTLYSLQSLSYIRVAAVTPELRIADVDFNTEEIIRCYRDARAQQAQVVVFPELSISAYTCGDLFYQHTLLEAVESSIAKLAELTLSDDGVLIVGAPIKSRGQLYNSAVVLAHGNIIGVVPKTFLPNYHEFYEARWFASSRDTTQRTIRLCGNDVPFGAHLLFEQSQSPLARATSFCFGIEICEDLWATKSPSTDMSLSGAHIIFNLSASNELIGKAQYRRDLICMQSARCIGAYVYCSAGSHESSTDVVFAGQNLVAENGVVLCESERFVFESQISMADIDIESLENDRMHNSTFRAEESAQEFERMKVYVQDETVPQLLQSTHAHPFLPMSPEMRESRCSEIFSLQCTALMKRLLHTNARNIVVGISGGLDSTLALLVCVESFRRLGFDLNGIHAISMPGFGTTEKTRGIARELATSLAVHFREISISASTLLHFKDIGHDPDVHDVVYENAQARERTQILMDIANAEHAFVVGTGDLSEIALGWNTFNGDHMSMYAVNCGIPKTLVRTLVEWIAESPFASGTGSLLRQIVDLPISPELLPLAADGSNPQQTERSIGPYELHDFYLYHMLRHHRSPQKIYALACIAFDGSYEPSFIRQCLRTFITRFFSQQFKRSAMPDGPKIGSIALSPRGDWRMPSDAQCRLWLQQIDAI